MSLCSKVSGFIQLWWQTLILTSIDIVARQVCLGIRRPEQAYYQIDRCDPDRVGAVGEVSFWDQGRCLAVVTLDCIWRSGARRQRQRRRTRIFHQTEAAVTARFCEVEDSASTPRRLFSDRGYSPQHSLAWSRTRSQLVGSN